MSRNSERSTRMRKIVLILSLFFCILVTAVEIVIYQFEFVQLNQELVTKLGLKEIEAKFPEDDEFFSISYLPKEMELNIVLPFVQMGFEAGQKTEKNRSSARPWLSTILNRKATIATVSEELSLFTGVRTGKGLKFELTPLRSLEEGILTKISIVDPYGPTQFENEIVVSKDAFSLIGVVTFKKDEGFQHVAVCAKASTVSTLPSENIYSSGNLDEMTKLFFGDVAKERSEVYGLVMLDETFQGQVNLILWTDKGILLRASLAVPSMRSSASLEKLVAGEGLRVGAKFSYGQGACLALGFSDVSKLTNFLSLFASFYPIKIDLKDATFKTPEWSFGTTVNFDEITVTIGMFSESTMVLSGDVKFNFSKNFFVSVGLAYDFSVKKPCFKVGFGVSF